MKNENEVGAQEETSEQRAMSEELKAVCKDLEAQWDNVKLTSKAKEGLKLDLDKLPRRKELADLAKQVEDDPDLSSNAHLSLYVHDVNQFLSSPVTANAEKVIEEEVAAQRMLERLKFKIEKTKLGEMPVKN
jgi:hypothetical protein